MNKNMILFDPFVPSRMPGNPQMLPSAMLKRVLGDLIGTVTRFHADLAHTWPLQMGVRNGAATFWKERPYVVSERCSSAEYASGKLQMCIRMAVGRRALPSLRILKFRSNIGGILAHKAAQACHHREARHLSTT